MLSRTVSELYRSLLFKFLDTLHFEPPWGRGLKDNVRCHLGLIGKRVVDFLLVLIELFHHVLQLRLYERLSVQNRRFRSNAVSLTQNFR